MKSIGIPPLFIYVFHYSFNKYLQAIYLVQGLTLEPWGLQSPQGIYNPEIKAMIISSMMSVERVFYRYSSLL